jgi:hypothetical protein
MNAAFVLKKANEAKAAADAYGTVRLVALSSKTIANGSDPRTVKQILQAMPPNMPQDSAETNQVHRAANAVHNVPEVGYGNYTGSERRAAVLEMVKGKLSFALAADPLGIYGVPKSTLQGDLERLSRSVGVSTNKELKALYNSHSARIDAEIAAIVFPTAGPRRFLSPTEACIVAGVSSLSTHTGAGADRIDIAEMARAIVHKKGEDMMAIAETDQQRSTAERFINAKISKPYARGLGTDQAAPMAEEGTTNGFSKASNISHTRAAAMNPLLDGIMRAMYKALFDDLHQKGLISGPTPEPFRMHSADEVGIDVLGTWLEFFSLGSHDSDQRNFRTVAGERSPF